MCKGMMVNHVCDCGHRQNISKIAMARRNGTRCSRCGRNMQPTESGWKTLALATSAKYGDKDIEKIPVKKMVVDVYEEERMDAMMQDHLDRGGHMDDF